MVAECKACHEVRFPWDYAFFFQMRLLIRLMCSSFVPFRFLFRKIDVREGHLALQ